MNRRKGELPLLTFAVAAMASLMITTHVSHCDPADELEETVTRGTDGGDDVRRQPLPLPHGHRGRPARTAPQLLSGVGPVHAADLCGRVTTVWLRIRRC